MNNAENYDELLLQIKTLEKSIVDNNKKLYEINNCINSDATSCNEWWIENQINICRDDLNIQVQKLNFLEKRLVSIKELKQNKSKIAVDRTDELLEFEKASGISLRNEKKVWATDNTSSSDIIDKGFETKVGKNLMAVLASLFIFISIILFAIIISPSLTDTIKVAALFVVTTSASALGIYKLNKRKEDVFWLAVSGCGLGGFYITLFLCNVYFKMIGNIPLYACLLLWSVLVCVLSKLRSYVFQIIGYTGIVISVIFGLMVTASTETTQLGLLVIYTIISLSMFGIANLNRDDYSRNIPSIITSTICEFSIVGVLPDANLLWIKLVLTAYILAKIFLMLYVANPEKARVTQSVTIAVRSLSLWLYMRVSMADVSGHVIKSLIVLGFMILIHYLYELKKIDNRYDECEPGTVLGFMSFIYVLEIIVMGNEYISILIIPIIYIVLGKLLGKQKYYLMAVIVVGIEMFARVSEHLVILLAYIVVCMAVASIVLGRLEKRRCRVFNIPMYCCLYFMLTVCLGELFENAVITVLVPTAINMLMCVFEVYKHDGKQEKGMLITHVSINAFEMLVIMRGIIEYKNPYIFIVAAMIAFSLTTKKLIDMNNIKTSIYVGIKYTVVVLAILYRFNVVNYAVSGVLFMIAIISIIIGFVIKRQGLRIYGFILSLLSIAKLVLLDIEYSNLTGRAIGFFVCGILCFGISFIYNVVDKKMSANDDKASNA